MDTGVAALVRRRHGLITHADAVAAGLDERQVSWLLRHGAWRRLRRGVYVDAATWEGLDEFVGRPRLITRAAHLTLVVEHALSHGSAALEHGLPLLDGAVDLVHVSRNGIKRGRTRNGIKEHAADHAPADLLGTADLPVLGIARTAVDVAREHGYAAGLAACDRALRLGVQRDELNTVIAGMRHWPGIRVASAAVAQADPGADTAGESLARILVKELGIGEPRTQFPLRLGDGRVIWIDLVVGCHAFEFDGRLKYRTSDSGGVATDVERAVWEEKKRERLVRAERLGVSRIIWADYYGPARRQAVARLRAEHANTVAQFGDRLPAHLEEYAARMSAQRARRLVSSPPVLTLPMS
jgi:hypothetical protein